jgi:hypothetical protein
MEDLSDYTRKNCKIPFGEVCRKIEDGSFGGYSFPSSIEDVPLFQNGLRTHINTIFPSVSIDGLTDCPSRYDIGLLLYIYQTQPNLILSLQSWDNMKDYYKAKLYKQPLSSCLNQCLCSHIISQNYIIEENSKYIILGCVCIRKNGGALKDELDKLHSYSCIICNKLYKENNTTNNICGRCTNKSRKNECINCKKTTNCDINKLCKRCRCYYNICNIHPIVTLSIARKHTCYICREIENKKKQQERMDGIRQQREQQLMLDNDPIEILRIQKYKQEQIDRDILYKERMQQENKNNRDLEKKQLKILLQNDKMTNYNLLIPFEKKDLLKTQYKLKWDNEIKMWHTTSQSTYGKLLDYHVIDLEVTYENKDIAKKLGAKWNGKHWITSRLNYNTHQQIYDALKENKPDTDEDETV